MTALGYKNNMSWESSSDEVPTKVIMNSVNCSLLAAGKATLSSVDVGKLVRLAFGSTVERKSARVQGYRSYVYCGIRRKSDHEESPAKHVLAYKSHQRILHHRPLTIYYELHN